MDQQGEPVQQGPELPQQATGSGGAAPEHFLIGGNPFSPTAAAPNVVQIDMTQLQLLMSQMVETAQAASQAAQAAVARPAGPNTAGFSDANKILNRPSEFGSAVHDSDLASWAEWSHGFKTWLIFAESLFEVDLKLVEDNLGGPVDLTGAAPDRIARSQRLYAILASLLRAKPKAILRQITDRNGLEVWRVLTNTYAPKTKFRGLALLNALMALPVFGRDKSLREHIHGLERVANEYQRVTGRQPGEDVMLGTLVRCLPTAIKQHVQLQMTDSSTYASVRDYVLGYEVTTTSWTPAKMHQALGVVPVATASDQGPVPMEVDALQKKGPKGKNKGKGRKGKGGQQPQSPPSTKGKAKEGKQQKGKNKRKDHKGKGGQQPQSPSPSTKGSRANVVCHNCQRKGHYAAECWASSCAAGSGARFRCLVNRWSSQHGGSVSISGCRQHGKHNQA